MDVISRNVNQGHGISSDPEPQVRNTRQRKDQVKILAEENRGLMDSLLEKRVTGHKDAHLTTNLKGKDRPMPTKLSPDEKQTLYEKKKQFRVNNQAFVRVSRDEASPGSNIIESHVGYFRKAGGSAALPTDWRPMQEFFLGAPRC